MFANTNDNSAIMSFNGLGVAVAYGMLGVSLFLSTEVPLATKGFWAMGVFLLTVSLVNLVKLRFEERQQADRVKLIEAARNEKLLSDYVGDAQTFGPPREVA